MLAEGTLRASYQTLRLVQDKTFWTSQALHVRRLTTRWTSQWASFTLPSCAVCIRAHGALLSRYASMCIKKLACRTTCAFTGIWRVTLLAQWWTESACTIRWFRILAWRENSDTVIEDALFSFVAGLAQLAERWSNEWEVTMVTWLIWGWAVRLGECCVELHHGTFLGCYRFFYWLLQSCAENRVKIRQQCAL